MKLQPTFFLIAIFALCSPATIVKAVQTGQSGSAEKYVDDFYAWYQRPQPGSASEDRASTLVSERADDLGEHLKALLSDDLKAQQQAPDGEVVGLEFDPFLDSQDDVGACHATSLHESRSGYDVTVGCVGRSDHFDLLVRHDAAKWRIENVRYADGADLIAILESLRKSRLDQYR